MKYEFWVNYLFKGVFSLTVYGEKLSSEKLVSVHTYVDYSVDGIFFFFHSQSIC